MQGQADNRRVQQVRRRAGSLVAFGGTAQRQDIRAHGGGTGQAFKRDGQGTAAHAQKGHAPGRKVK